MITVTWSVGKESSQLVLTPPNVPMSVGEWRKPATGVTENGDLLVDVADTVIIDRGTGRFKLFGDCANISMVHSTVLSLV